MCLTGIPQNKIMLVRIEQVGRKRIKKDEKKNANLVRV
jgi:hypothetical protein